MRDVAQAGDQCHKRCNQPTYEDQLGDEDVVRQESQENDQIESGKY